MLPLLPLAEISLKLRVQIDAVFFEDTMQSRFHVRILRISALLQNIQKLLQRNAIFSREIAFLLGALELLHAAIDVGSQRVLGE